MRKWVAAPVLIAALGSCAAGVAVPGDLLNGQLAELWNDPADLANRNLFYGPGGSELAPRPDAHYEIDERETAGFSITFDLRDNQGREWSVKIGPEAQTEVAAARLVWAMGYHQPAAYYVPKWTYKGANIAPVHGRFRPKLPGLKQAGNWDWRKNPFVGTQPLKGLKVLMLMLNNSDIKAPQNVIYDVDAKSGPRRWFVVKDLGATLGETGVVNPRRGWIEGFEKHGFITGVDEGKVKFEYHGRFREVFDDVTPADVRWMCERLDRLSPKQWSDAFRAGGYDEAISARYIARIQEKIRQGKNLQ